MRKNILKIACLALLMPTLHVMAQDDSTHAAGYGISNLASNPVIESSRIEIKTNAGKWHDMTGLRVNNGVYVNTHPYTIYVSIRSSRTGHEYGVFISVDGIPVYRQAINPDGDGYSNGIVPVPPGSTYQGYSSNGLAGWYEMF